MPDKILATLVSVIAALNALHALDHILRGDVHWPLDGPSVAFVLITVVTYGVLGFGLVLYRTQRVGPRFWTLVGLGGLAFGWLAHFSPFTDQPPAVILAAYTSRWAGGFALACLLALMLVVLSVTVYAGWLWRTTPQADGHATREEER
jgi:hypothetical protein